MHPKTSRDGGERDLKTKAFETVFGPNLAHLAAKRAKKEPKLTPQNDPKSIKNGARKMIKKSIKKKTVIPRFWGWPGGLRWALGGKIRGVKHTKIFRKLMFGDFFLHFWLQQGQIRTRQ